ncbi:hypothetical protein [Virgibacillus pantothenticus]|uniref:hypothetical protein n=1 Tax=Virgibacillus pantothenticus TaxID=1473 RepID=UPI000985B466|nr:hypothetical protein [Virgibacillus pantothenticus]
MLEWFQQNEVLAIMTVLVFIVTILAVTSVALKNKCKVKQYDLFIWCCYSKFQINNLPHFRKKDNRL